MSSLSIVPPAGVTGFNALSHLDQRNANNGNQFSIEPPNPSIAVGNGYVLEGVNDAIQIFNTSGTPPFRKCCRRTSYLVWLPLSTGQPGANGVYFTDMRVFFDPATR